ncbi:MAG: hypothetical protein ACJ79A_11585 [Gemmatimonadaceae bacterium]
MCLALAAVAPLHAQEAARAPAVPSPPSIVEGRVMRPAITGEVPVPGIVVTIHRVGADSSGAIDSMRTDARGAYRFAYRRWGNSDAIYFVAAVYQGIAYFSSPMRAAIVRGDEAEIVVFDTTTSPVRFTVQGHHYVVGAARPTGLRDIVEVYEISNDTVVTMVGRDSLSAVWSAPLLRGATNFTPSNSDVSASSIRARDGRVELSAPFAPGVKQLTWTYTLDANAFPLDITLDRPNALLEVLVEEPGAQVRATSLRSQGTATTEGRTFKRFVAQNAPEGEHIRIEVPSTAAAARSTVVIALLVVAAIAMIAALWIAYRRGIGTRPVVAMQPDSVDSLAAAIAVLDARHDAHDPSLTADEYTAKRTALKARLSAVLAAGPRPA